MTYICIKCKALWVVDEPSAEFSGGLCDDCIIEYVRERQSKEGLDPCFRCAIEPCSRHECTYHELCCRPLTKDNYEPPKDYFKHNTCQL